MDSVNYVISVIRTFTVDGQLPKADVVFDFLDHEGFMVTFGIAKNVDSHIFGRSGCYWMGAYDHPKVGDIVNIPVNDEETEPFRVDFAGIFTFSIEELSLHP